VSSSQKEPIAIGKCILTKNSQNKCDQSFNKMITVYLGLLALIALARPVESGKNLGGIGGRRSSGGRSRQAGQKFNCDDQKNIILEAAASQDPVNPSFLQCLAYVTKCREFPEDQAAKPCEDYATSIKALIYGVISLVLLVVVGIIVCCIVKCVC